MQALKLRRLHKDTFKLTSLAPKCYTLYTEMLYTIQCPNHYAIYFSDGFLCTWVTCYEWLWLWASFAFGDGCSCKRRKQISSDNLFDKMILFLALFQCIPNN